MCGQAPGLVNAWSRPALKPQFPPLLFLLLFSYKLLVSPLTVYISDILCQFRSISMWDGEPMRFLLNLIRVARRGASQQIKKVTLLDYFSWFPALSYHPTQSTLTSVCIFFFISLPHTSVGIVEFNLLLSNGCGLNHAIGFTCVSSSGPEVPLSREEEVDLTLLKNDSGVESALLYAKAWSRYLKDLLSWMEKRLAMGKSRRKDWYVDE